MSDGQDIQANLPDGTELHFPAGTSMDVVQRAVKTQLAGGAHPTGKPPITVTNIPTATQAAPSAPPAPNIDPTVPQRFIEGLLGPLAHPVDTAKALLASGKQAYQNLKERPLQALIHLAASELQTGASIVAPPTPAQTTQGLTAAAQEPNALVRAARSAEALAPQGGNVLGLGGIAAESAKGNIAGAVGKGVNSGLALISSLPEPGMFKAGEAAVTRGVGPDASRLAEWLEPKLAKIPGNALQQAYQHNQTLLRATLAEGLKDALVREIPAEFAQTGQVAARLNPDEVVDNFSKAASAFKAPARANYREVDQFLETNKPLAKAVQGTFDATGGLVVKDENATTFENLKMSIAKLYKRSESLMNNGLGTEANQVAGLARQQEGLLNQIKQSMPPELQQKLATADRLWLEKSATEDIAQVLKKPSVVHGAPPSAQSPLTKIQQQQFGGAALLREATLGDDAVRFQQVFGPETTRQITDLADLIGKQQGAGGAGGNMGMMGSMLIMSAARGGFTRVLSPIAGLDLMARALASPDNWTLIRGMLTGNRTAALTLFAPRLLEQMRQKGELPEYMYEQAPSSQAPAGATPPATTNTPPVSGGASIGDQLRSKGISLPGQQPQVPQLPFHPGAGL